MASEAWSLPAETIALMKRSFSDNVCGLCAASMLGQSDMKLACIVNSEGAQVLHHTCPKHFCQCGIEMTAQAVCNGTALTYVHPNGECPLTTQTKAADRLLNALRLEL